MQVHGWRANSRDQCENENSVATPRRWRGVVRFLNEPKVAVACGVLLIAGSAVAGAVAWPPAHAVLRVFSVGVLLILRGIARHYFRRWRRRAQRRNADSVVPGVPAQRPDRSGPTPST